MAKGELTKGSNSHNSNHNSHSKVSGDNVHSRISSSKVSGSAVIKGSNRIRREENSGVSAKR